MQYSAEVRTVWKATLGHRRLGLDPAGVELSSLPCVRSELLVRREGVCVVLAFASFMVLFQGRWESVMVLGVVCGLVLF